MHGRGPGGDARQAGSPRRVGRTAHPRNVDADPRRRGRADLFGYDPVMDAETPTGPLTGPGGDDDRTSDGPAPRPPSEGDRARAVGSSIGPYRLVRAIGEGGFGVVYLAEQTSPVRRRVAVKVIKPGMDSGAVLARFEAERQALALMDHPFVAKVFDGGTTERGLPYFVMEFVEGEPITAFCDRVRLGLRERLELFVRVCEAVQHAHAKGVIHRDLKPGNILASRDDNGRAQPKVIDFGIAKALDQELAEATIFTHHGQMLGTPEYMSPEQAEMGPGGVDTRTDVYALGVVLYELLTARRPFDPRRLRSAGLAEIHRIIREEDPPRPSTRLGAASAVRAGEEDREDTAASAAERRGTQVRSLTSALRRDLDWVAMRCLEKDRERRYPTPAALAEDVRRYLRNEPVSAGPPSASYRASKFIRRHRSAVIVGGVVAATLLVATAVSVRFGVIAQRERLAAEREAAASAAVTAFLTDDLLLAAGLEDDQATADPDIRVSEALDRAAARIGERFPAMPMVRARVMSVIGRAYRAIGVPGLAEPLLEEASGLFRDAGAEAPGVSAELLRNDLALGLSRWRLGRTAEAIETLRAVVRDAASVRESDPAAYWGALAELGNALKHHGSIDEAETIYRGVIAGRSSEFGPDDPSIAVTRYNLALIPVSRALAARSAGDEAAFRRLLERALVELRVAERSLSAAYGDSHPRTLAATSEVAVQLNRLDRLDEAAPIYDALLPRMAATLGDRHQRTLIARANHGRLLQKLGRHAEAAPLFRDALRGFLVNEGAESRTGGAIAGFLATSLEALGEESDVDGVLARALGDLREAGLLDASEDDAATAGSAGSRR